MEFNIEVRGAKPFGAKLRRFRQKVHPKRIVNTVTLRVLRHLKESVVRHSPGAPVWGRLTQRGGKSGIIGSIRATVEQMAGGFIGRVGSGGKKGEILRAHEYGVAIRPVKKKVLHFFTFEGEEVFARRVRLPARPTFGTTHRQMKDKVPGIISRMLTQTQREVEL